MFAAYAIGRLLTAVGVTPGGLGVTETGTAAVLVGWGAHPAQATAGVVLFSIFTHLMEIPLGALGWLAWTMSRPSGGNDSDGNDPDGNDPDGNDSEGSAVDPPAPPPAEPPLRGAATTAPVGTGLSPPGGAPGAPGPGRPSRR
jgi:hypothetical protein